MDSLLAWLFADESHPGSATAVRRDLLDQGEDEPQVQDERRAMLADPQVQGLLAELAGWPGKVVSSHKSAGQPFHKLTFAADLGLRADDPGVGAIIERILAHPSAQGPFSLPMTIAPAYGGSGQEQWAWALCDAPLILYALLKFGLGEDAPVQRPSHTWPAWCARTAGPARSRPSWEAGGGRAARRIPARSPTWRCSRRWARRRSGAIAGFPPGPRRCWRYGLESRERHPLYLLHGDRLP